MSDSATSKRLSFAGLADSSITKVELTDDRTTISALAKEVNKPIHFVQARLYAARIAPVGFTSGIRNRSFVFAKESAIKAVTAPASRLRQKATLKRSKWRPIPSDRMKKLAVDSRGMSDCPATNLACCMANRCAFADDMKHERSGAALAGLSCLNNTQGIGAAATCNKCLHFGEQTCVFNCFRIDRRGKIRMVFRDESRQDAFRSIEREFE